MDDFGGSELSHFMGFGRCLTVYIWLFFFSFFPQSWPHTPPLSQGMPKLRNSLMVEKKGLAKAWRCSDLTVLAVLILILLVEALAFRRGKVGHPAVLLVHPGSVVQQTWTKRAPAKSCLTRCEKD